MVRRTRDEACATREALLDAAEAVFRHNGVTRTSLAQIAAAAGVTRGAIYWHFRDKGELFGAMVSRATLPLEAALESAARAQEDDALATLRDVGVRGLTEIATNPRTRAVLEILLHKIERAGRLASCAPQPDEMDRHCLRSLQQVMCRAIAQDLLPADTDPLLAATAMHGYVSGIIEMWLGEPRAFDLAAAAPALIDTIIAGLRTAPPRLSRSVAQAG
jgi:TetR/AcrR family transcriptional regulator, acrAB operon repressor